MNISENFQLFILNGAKHLKHSLERELGVEASDVISSKFSDGEIALTINESVRGADVYVVQSVGKSTNDSVMELLVMLDALKRASAGRVTVVVPYFPYSRQDRKARPRDPISAKLLANLIQTAGASRVITLDLHASQIQGFFDIPVDTLESKRDFVEFLDKEFQLTENREYFTIVAPDFGAVKKARFYSSHFQVPLAVVEKIRSQPNVSEAVTLIGDVKGKDCIIIDDMIDTAGTLCNAAKLLKEHGANKIYALATHPVFSGCAFERITDSVLDAVYTLNTIHHDVFPVKYKAIHSLPKLLASAIQLAHTDTSTQSLFI